MKSLKLTTIAVLMTLTGATAAVAENLEHTRQLLATKQCTGCDLSGAGLVLSQLQGANLQGANLQGANLSQSNLTGADLSNAQLTGSSLAGANLAGANLAGADLRGVDLRGAFLGGANLQNARLEGTSLEAAIAIPEGVVNYQEFYRWAIAAGQSKRFEVAIGHFDQAISQKSDYAPAWLGRGAAKVELGQNKAAIEDLEKAIELFNTQGDKASAESTQKVVQALKNPPREKNYSGIGQSVLGLMGMLLRYFVAF
ncbi:pentapeptide repeat-containing protein [Alkalinema pantanalense CENA528]|uniref:pentapeptide repeat-containing protein n=1 Tax=Alkalinema pantanalense TaxID=1620705 RepID=UPI003D6F3484